MYSGSLSYTQPLSIFIKHRNLTSEIYLVTLHLNGIQICSRYLANVAVVLCIICSLCLNYCDLSVI